MTDDELDALVARVRNRTDWSYGCPSQPPKFVLDLCVAVESLGSQRDTERILRREYFDRADRAEAREHTAFNAYERMCRLADKRQADFTAERAAHEATRRELEVARDATAKLLERILK